MTPERAGIVLIALLALVTGCPDLRKPIIAPPFNDRATALRYVNENLGRINAPLRASAWVSFKFQDEQGKSHSFSMQEARLDFMPSQSFLFDVRSLAGTVAQFGSNDERYWFWVDIGDVQKMWWGSWERLRASSERRMPVPPNELLDALMLRPLPETLEGGLLPVMQRDGQNRLVFVRLGPGRQPMGWREIYLDARERFLPGQVIDRTADGEVVMDAQMSRYQQVDRNGPWVPHRYIVRWPRHDAQMNLDLRGVQFTLKLPEDAFDFPAWNKAIEQIDPPSEARKP
jgi:hypothetical protein